MFSMTFVGVLWNNGKIIIKIMENFLCEEQENMMQKICLYFEFFTSNSKLHVGREIKLAKFEHDTRSTIFNSKFHDSISIRSRT